MNRKSTWEGRKRQKAIDLEVLVLRDSWGSTKADERAA